MHTPLKVTVVTVSDRVAAGVREDRSGPLAQELVTASLGVRAELTVVPDGAASVADAVRAALASGSRLVVTTGGTGVSPRDRTPEGTAPLLDRELPGVAEAIRRAGAEHTPHAVLTRGLVGVVDAGSRTGSDGESGHPGAVVANLPGSTGGVRDGLAVLLPLVPHLLDQLAGGDHT
ncbi:MogA/MoaB family molybdenum cofactor biosynthesis protein [Kytococcus sedentarius]|uniref:MogA/MoaB family molybdenum cofactor biosynthesis protein n=1 Tax=Kytococcus sedentarius TaxID=1276 RepID=UPI0035BBA024